MKHKRIRDSVVTMVVCLMLFGITSSAAEIVPFGNQNFDILLTKNGIGEDPISPRETKDDNEQKYYVTITSSNSSRGRLTAEVYQVDNQAFRSNKVSMSSAAGTSVTGNTNLEARLMRENHTTFIWIIQVM